MSRNQSKDGVTRQLPGNVEAGSGRRSEVRPGYILAPWGAEGITGYGMGGDWRGANLLYMALVLGKTFVVYCFGT